MTQDELNSLVDSIIIDNSTGQVNPNKVRQVFHAIINSMNSDTASISATAPLNYDSFTNVFSMLQASDTQNGWLSKEDWITFNASIGITDELPEGTTNLYFTTARVLATLLSGISFVTGGAIVSTDTVLHAFGKIQKQINDILSTLIPNTRTITINGTTQDLSADRSYSVSVPNATETTAGSVSVGTQTFGGNKIIVGESATIGNAFTVQNLSHTVVAQISNLGDSYFNAVRIGKGKGNLANNTVLGNTALNNNTTGINATAIGIEALASNTTGNNNTAVGADALYRNTTGAGNTAIGVLALFNNTTGANNSAIGFNALLANTTGSNNTAYGKDVLGSNTTGTENIGIGYGALNYNITGSYNIALGNVALLNNTTGSNNTALGNSAGRFISGGVTVNSITDNSIYIGQNTKALANNQTNQIVIGYDATGAGSNTATIGNTSIVKTVLRGVIAHSTSYTVATLPTGALGDTAFVTDAVAPTYLGALIGGGSVACPVFHDGISWKSH